MPKTDFSVSIRKNTLKGEIQKTVFLDIRRCVPMPELEREFYDDYNYQKLKKSIARDGLKSCYPIRVRWNDKKKVYEVFVGIHRLRAAKELGTFAYIPAIIETELDRQQAFADGISDNYTHASYNPVDFARHIREWGEKQAKKESRAVPSGKGRPKTVGLRRIAEKFLVTEDIVNNYLRMLKLPEEVLRLIGRGKLWVTHSIILARLLGTPYEDKIPSLAKETVEKQYTERTLEKIVEAIKHKGSYNDDCACYVCKRVFPYDSFVKPTLCPDCMGKLRSGKLDRDVVEKHNEARREYLKFNAIVERVCKDKKIPDSVNEYLDKLYCGWLGKHLER